MDITTLTYITILNNLFIGLFFIAIRQKKHKAINYWITINFLVAIGLSLIMLRGTIPDFLSIVVANFMLFFALLFRFFGYKKILESKVTKVEIIVGFSLLFVATSIHTIFSVWSDNLFIRMFNYNGYFIFIGISIFIFLLNKTKKNKIYSIVAISFILFAGIYLIRNLGLLITPSYTHYLQSNFYNSLALVAQIFFDIFWAVSLVLIYAEKATLLQKQSEERYKTLSDLTFEGILIHNKGVAVDINLAFTKIVGYSREEIVGQNVIPKTIHPECIETVKEKVENKVTKPYQVKGIRKDGKIIDVELESRYINHKNERLRVTAIRDLTLRNQQEKALRKALETKEVLLQEIHHRVKNNLQTIVSLLNQQQNQASDTEVIVALRDSMSRVMSMALVHQFIYRSNNLENINMKNYLNELVNKLATTYKKSRRTVNIEILIDEIFFDIDQSIPVALMINEILSNIFKYAFSEKEAGQIQIKFLKQKDEKHYLLISDNGVGFPENFEPEKSKSLGLYLIKNFAKRQLRGNLKITSAPNKGVKYEIEF